MKIYHSVSELIGNTPIVLFNKFASLKKCNANLFAKLEYLNPSGSAKDRVGKEMIDTAIKSGLINKNTVIIEPTSGNTGIGIAAYATQLGLKTLICMPENMSNERKMLLSAFGAELMLTSAAEGMTGAINKAKELSEKYDNSFIPSQFVNPANPMAHYKTTGPEIWNDMCGNIDYFICGVGTGGTITGTGRYLKEKNSNIKVIAVEPFDSPVLSGGNPGKHGLQGIGAGFIPETLDTSVYDKIITVKTEEAFDTSREISKTEGVLVGISSGAAMFAALQIGYKEPNKNIVVLLPDSGERYLSSGLFEVK